MKHLLTLAVGATAALALAATPSLAGTFGLFYCRGHCDKCAFCIRPYNAFTPVVCGTADGLTAQGYGPPGCPPTSVKYSAPTLPSSTIALPAVELSAPPVEAAPGPIA